MDDEELRVNDYEDNEDGGELRIIEGDSTIDTHDRGQVEAWMAEVQEIGPDQGPAFRALVEKLPKTRDACGRGISNNRLLKALRSMKNLPSTEINKIKEKKSVAAFTQAQLLVYHDLIDRCFSTDGGSEPERVLLRKGLVLPFEEQGAGGGGGGGEGSGPRPDSEVNRILLMALTVTSPEAVPFLEKAIATVPEADRPAALDVPGGITGTILAAYEGLRVLSETLKTNSEFDLSRFSKEHLGSDEAAQALSGLSPLGATIPSAAAFKAMHTQWCNANDELCGKVDASGGHVAGVARRQTCYEKFIGQTGRSKNISLFLVFVLFEGAEKRFTSRVLPTGKGVGSNEHGNTPALAKKNKQQPRQEMSLTISRPPVDPEEALATKRLKAAQENLVKEKTNSERATRLQAIISNPAIFGTFSAARQQELQEALYSSLIGNQ